MALMTPIEPIHDTTSTLFEQHYSHLVRLAAVLIDDVGSCEEIVQEAFAKLLTARPGPAPGKEAPYLRSAVLNGARSRLRRRQVRRRNADPAPPPHPAAEQEAVHNLETRRVLEALRSLPPRQAEVLALRFQADLSEVEIAETLDISTGSVKTHASRGIANLRARLGDDS
jgi:RNA polymerase sigma-70 factor (sigma-E family)